MSTPHPPHLDERSPVLSTRRGNFWIPGEVTELGPVHVQKGPMFVEWEAPETPRHPHPLVLVHGGGGQGSDWMTTPDGRPGWARRLVEQGFVVYVVDRVGMGRSPYHPDVLGPMGGAFPYEAGQQLFTDPGFAGRQSAWPWSTEPGSAEFDQVVAGMGPLPADFSASQQMDADRLARLLDRIGPAVLVTHSAGGPVGWLTVDARPEGVLGVAAVEPMGPAFVDFPGLGELSWGLTAAPIRTDPPRETAAEVRDAGTDGLKMPAFEGLPVALVTGGASRFADWREEFDGILSRSGASVTTIHLPDHGIDGNGHGLLFETNSDEVLEPVVSWLATLDAVSSRG